ncbi:hypothetical protein LCGC14_1953150, partial [marine sediment metagenome]
MKYIWIVLFAFVVGCASVPPGAPEPEPDGPMGYPPEVGDLCSSDAAHKYAEPQGVSNAKCYK